MNTMTMYAAAFRTFPCEKIVPHPFTSRACLDDVMRNIRQNHRESDDVQLHFNSKNRVDGIICFRENVIHIYAHTRTSSKSLIELMTGARVARLAA